MRSGGNEGELGVGLDPMRRGTAGGWGAGGCAVETGDCAVGLEAGGWRLEAGGWAADGARAEDAFTVSAMFTPAMTSSALVRRI